MVQRVKSGAGSPKARGPGAEGGSGDLSEELGGLQLEGGGPSAGSVDERTGVPVKVILCVGVCGWLGGLLCFLED